MFCQSGEVQIRRGAVFTNPLGSFFANPEGSCFLSVQKGHILPIWRGSNSEGFCFCQARGVLIRRGPNFYQLGGVLRIFFTNAIVEILTGM